MEFSPRIQIDDDIQDVDLGPTKQLSNSDNNIRKTNKTTLLKLNITKDPDAKEQSLEFSPRSLFIKKKFKNVKDVIVQANFACAFTSSKLLLQGMLYLAKSSIYFYSPFNEKTLLGYGSKIHILYNDLQCIKKETAMLIFPNAIRFIFKSGEQILF